MIICLEIFTNLLQFLSKVKQIMKGDEPHNVILLSAKTIMKAVLNLKRSAQYARAWKFAQVGDRILRATRYQ